MALIKCEECGKNVSDKAASCPNCGAPINEKLIVKKERICPKCKGSVSNNAYKCPHCYSILDDEEGVKYVQSGQTNILAVMGFLFGLVSLFIDFVGIFGIVAVILSGVGLTQINNKNEKGTGFAVFGFIFGLLSIGYFVYKIIAYEQMISVFFQ